MKDNEKLIAEALNTDYGKKMLRAVIQESGAVFADMHPEGSFGWHLGRAVAGLPPQERSALEEVVGGFDYDTQDTLEDLVRDGTLRVMCHNCQARLPSTLVEECFCCHIKIDRDELKYWRPNQKDME